MKRKPAPITIRGMDYIPLDPSITQAALREKHARCSLDLSAGTVCAAILALILCLPLADGVHHALATLLGLVVLGDLILLWRIIRLTRRIEKLDPLVP